MLVRRERDTGAGERATGADAEHVLHGAPRDRIPGDEAVRRRHTAGSGGCRTLPMALKRGVGTVRIVEAPGRGARAILAVRGHVALARDDAGRRPCARPGGQRHPRTGHGVDVRGEARHLTPHEVRRGDAAGDHFGPCPEQAMAARRDDANNQTLPLRIGRPPRRGRPLPPLGGACGERGLAIRASPDDRTSQSTRPTAPRSFRSM